MIKYIDSIKELLVLYVVLLLSCAGLYAYFEHVAYGESIWWACVTALTIGYGDLYPETLGGKVTAVFLMHSTVLFILPLLIGYICARGVKDANAFTHEEQEVMKKDLQEIKNLIKEMF